MILSGIRGQIVGVPVVPHSALPVVDCRFTQGLRGGELVA